ncbi:MAG: PQQ-binding-like beta-propeller repeat protein [Planctomycetota bacterium]
MLQGELDSVDLAHVFQMLSINGKQGTLNIYYQGERRSILFTDRGVTLPNVQLPEEARILGILARLDRLPIEDLERVRSEVEESPVAALEILHRLGMVDDEDIREVLRSQVEEEIYELFLWRKARFEFDENQYDEELPSDPELYLNPNSLIMEAARRVDEWDVVQTQVRSDSAIFRISEAGSVHLDAGEMLDARDSYLMSMMDGSRNVLQIVRESGFERFYVCTFLHRMLAEGWIRELSEEELWSEGIAAVENGEYEIGVAQLELLLELGGGDDEVHARLAEGCEQLGELAKAARHYKIYGNAREKLGDFTSARRFYEHVSRLVPTDLEAQERCLVNAARVVPNEEEAIQIVEDGKRLAELFSEIGQRQKAIDLVRTLIGLDAKNLELRRLLARLHREAGNAKDVIKTYEEIARLHIDNGDPGQAILTYRNILALDRNRRDIASQIESLRQRQHQKQSLRRTLVRVLLGLLLVGLLGGLFGVYEWKARRAYAALEYEEHAKSGRFANARLLLERFIDEYPFSLSRLDAEEGLRKIDRIIKTQAKAETREVRRKEEYQSEQLRIAADYYDEGMSLLNRGRYDEALQKLFAASRLDVERGWLRERNVLEKINDLTQIIHSARDLRKHANELRAAGLYEEAFLELQKLRLNFGAVSASQDILLPQQIVTVPPNATLLLESGEPLDGRTPMVIDVRAGRSSRLKIVLEGHEPLWVEIDPDQRFDHRYILQRQGLWEFHLPGTPVGAPRRDGTSLLIATRSGSLASLEALSGQPRWSAHLPDLADIAAPPVIIARKLWVTTTEGRLFHVDIETGEVVQAEDFGDPLSQTLAAYGDTAYFGTSRGDLVALDVSSGEERWRQRLASAPVSEPVVEGQALFVRTRDGAVLELQAFTGKFMSRLYVGSGFSGELSVRGQKLFAAGEDGFLYAVDTLSGKVQWKHRLDDLVRERPIVQGGSIALAAHSELRKLNALTGSEHWRFTASATITAGPIEAEGRIYIGDSEGSVYSIRSGDGHLDWRCRGEDPVRALSIADAHVIVSDASGRIRAFAKD